MLLGFMLLLSLVRGVLVFGQQSVSEFRLFSPFISTAIYFSSFPPSTVRNDRIGRIWLALTIPMVVLIGLRWVQNLGGVNLGVPVEGSGGRRPPRRQRVYGFFLATSVMLTVPFWQQRDELIAQADVGWRATAAGGGSAQPPNCVDRAARRRRGGPAAQQETRAPRNADGDRRRIRCCRVCSSPYRNLAPNGWRNGNYTRSRRTFEWRTEGWSTLLEGWSGSPLNWIIGEPFGSGFARDVSGDLVASTTDPHNFYIMTLLRTGVIGMLAFIILAVGLLRALWRQGSDTSISLLAPDIFQRCW